MVKESSEETWQGPTRLIRQPGMADQLVQQKVRLQVVSGPDCGKQVLLEGERLLIGSHPQCDLALRDPSVSRQHAELRIVDKALLLQDLGSTNGTVIAGLRVREVVLPKSVELQLGNTRLRLVTLDEHVIHPLSSEGKFGDLLGCSPAMRALFAKLARAAASDATVLLQGESGTGKELAARALHEQSRRGQGPFTVVDCGSIPRELIESELFGHERGAFTGALNSRVGAFEQAHLGTLFLDEIGELELDMQPRLLRAIESREVKHLGSNERRPVDIRIIAGTNRHLQRRVAEGAFREDLYYRLAVVQLRLPPLRERREDIPLLVRHFIDELSSGDQRFQISEATMRQLAERPWPGNVRELRNVVEQAVAMGGVENPDETAASPSGSSAVMTSELPYKVARSQLLEQFEREYLVALLDRHGGNLSQSARAAQIDRVYLLRLLDKHGLRQRP